MAFLLVHEPCNAFWIWPRTVWSMYWHLDLCQFNSLVTLWLFFFDQISSLLLRAYFLRELFCFVSIQSLCFEGLWQWFGAVHAGGIITRRGDAETQPPAPLHLPTGSFLKDKPCFSVQTFGKKMGNMGIVFYTPLREQDGCNSCGSGEAQLSAPLVTSTR